MIIAIGSLTEPVSKYTDFHITHMLTILYDIHSVDKAYLVMMDVGYDGSTLYKQ